MTLEEHAAAIESALKAAAADGFYLDNGDSGPVRMDLNKYGSSTPWGIVAWVGIDVPE